jgi:GxxExxY protein
VKSVAWIADEFLARTINYLKVSGNKLGIVVNFGEMSLKYKRLLN